MPPRLAYLQRIAAISARACTTLEERVPSIRQEKHLRRQHRVLVLTRECPNVALDSLGATSPPLPPHQILHPCAVARNIVNGRKVPSAMGFSRT